MRVLRNILLGFIISMLVWLILVYVFGSKLKYFFENVVFELDIYKFRLVFF